MQGRRRQQHAMHKIQLNLPKCLCGAIGAVIVYKRRHRGTAMVWSQRINVKIISGSVKLFISPPFKDIESVVSGRR